MRRLVLLAVVALLASGGFAGPAAAAQPDSKTQPATDGCERNPLALIAGTTPNWAYVGSDPAPKYLSGTARNARPTETDNFRTHDSYDMNVFFAPDPAYHDFLGTANTSTEETQAKDEQDAMEIEWEQRAWTLPSWPTAGDRIELMGAWIWDCGHWGPQDFTDPLYFLGQNVTTGERTEIHPPRMVVVHRAVPSTSSRGDAVTDVLISSVGTLATAHERYASGACPTPPDTCSQWVPVNDRDYEFDVAAPPRPPGATGIRWDVADQGTVNAPEALVSVTGSGIHVKVPFKGWGHDGDTMTFARRYQVGWDVATPVHHLRVTLGGLDWKAELDGPSSGQCDPNIDIPCDGKAQFSAPPDEVNVYVDVAGQWHQLTAPKLLAIAPGDHVDFSDTFDVYLAGSPDWRVLVRGRECDNAGFKECDVPTELGENEDAGISVDSFHGTGAAGEHVARGTSEECQTAVGGPCYTLGYRVEDLGVLGAQSSVAPSTPPQAAGRTRGLPATGSRPWPVLAVAGLLGAGLAGRRLLTR